MTDRAVEVDEERQQQRSLQVARVLDDVVELQDVVLVEGRGRETLAQSRVGDIDPGSTSSGDGQINRTYKTVAGPIKAGPSQVLPLGVTTRYLLIWITKLPSVGDGKYQVAVDEITVNGG